VREDAQTLYGFAGRDERDCFEALLGAHGVGPALALAIQSVHTPDGLRRALADDDVAALCLVPGVGRKTAARLLVELKSRLDLPDGGIPVTFDAAAGVNGTAPSARADVRDALVGLGYGPDEIAHALRQLSAEEDPTVEESPDAAVLLRRALLHLAGAR
jgi:Holliday junction DNA helicase RuvA